MELKDLILLVLMPIVLITIVTYININPTITGAATSGTKDDNIVGTYSVNPSFKTKINNDLDDYNNIKVSLDELSKCMEKGKKIANCIDEINNKDQPFSWSINCDKGAYKIFYDFAEFYQDCFDSDDNNCLCSKDLRISKEKWQEYGYINYKINLTEDKDTRKKIDLEMAQLKISLSYTVNTNGMSGWIPFRYNLGYNSEGTPALNLFFKDEVSGNTITFGPTKEITLYKNQLRSNIKSLDFVKKDGDNLKYPNDELVVDSNKISIDAQNLHPCKLKPKNTFKFCVTKKDYKIMAYDKEDGKVMERPLMIKFASYIADQAPPPLTNVEAYDRPKAEKSVLIKWDKSTADDVAKYRIYYVQTSDALEKTKTQELIKNTNVMSLEIDPISA